MPSAKRNHFTTSGKQNGGVEAEKRLDDPKKAEDRSEHVQGEKEADFAREGLNAAQSDDIRETIKEAALIKVVQIEVRSAKTQFEEVKELREKIELQGKSTGYARLDIPCETEDRRAYRSVGIDSAAASRDCYQLRLYRQRGR